MKAKKVVFQVVDIGDLYDPSANFWYQEKSLPVALKKIEKGRKTLPEMPEVIVRKITIEVAR